MPAMSIELLVVEDQEQVRNLLVSTLSPRGFSVHLAASGNEAVAFFREHHEAIGVVLLDVVMPGGLNGAQTLAALREIDPNIRVVMMTGNPGDLSPEELVRLAVAGVVPKPFASIRALARTLRNAAGEE